MTRHMLYQELKNLSWADCSSENEWCLYDRFYVRTYILAHIKAQILVPISATAYVIAYKSANISTFISKRIY